MFAISGDFIFHLYSQPSDMRKSLDALSGIVRNSLDCDPLNGDVSVFINKPRNKIKLLHWQSSGFVLYYKRLERGTFEIPQYDSSVGSIQISYTQLAMIIDGLSIKNLVQRERYLR
ncbi:MAG: IS66 family insertion sequence element accessory protein TnpB [Mangrovibacterium sp.]